MPYTPEHKTLLAAFIKRASEISGSSELIKILRSNTYNFGSSCILVRTASDIGRRYFFGLNYITAEEIYNLDNSYIAFICGSLDKIIFVPSEVLINLLPQISHDRNGEYKINITKELKIVLKGRGNHFDCDDYINNWDALISKGIRSKELTDPVDSIHSIIQGRLLEIGKLRGYQTYSPDKKRTFNKKALSDFISLHNCPELQYTQHELLRNIDVLWFRRSNSDYYPERAFEVEITTGVWSGLVRLATLKEFQTKLYVVTNNIKRFNQGMSSMANLKERFISITPEKIGTLYSAELNLIQLRDKLRF